MNFFQEGAEAFLQKQIISQRMMENLINDLLDLAKMENNSFSLSQDFFNLGDTISEAFEMLLYSAN